MTRACPILLERIDCGDDCGACRVDWTERAAIIEHDGKETRQRAEALATAQLRASRRGQKSLV